MCRGACAMAKLAFVFIVATIVVAAAMEEGLADPSGSRDVLANREKRSADFLKRLRNWLQHMLARTEELILSGVTEDVETPSGRRAYQTLTQKLEIGVSNLVNAFEELGAYVGSPSPS